MKRRGLRIVLKRTASGLLLWGWDEDIIPYYSKALLYIESFGLITLWNSRYKCISWITKCDSY